MRRWSILLGLLIGALSFGTQAFPPTLVGFFQTATCTSPTQVGTTVIAPFSQGGASPTAAGTITVANANDTIIATVFGASGGGATTVTVSDSVGGSLTSDVQTSQLASGPDYLQVGIYHLYSAASGAHTVTATMSSGAYNAYGYMTLEEFSNINSSAMVLTNSNSNAGSNNPTTGSVTPSTSCNAVISTVSLNSTSSSVTFGHPPSGYTSLAVETNGSTANFVAGSADYLSSASGAQNPSYATFTAANPWAAAVAVYSGAGGSPPPSTAIKWHPGQYMSSNVYTTINNTNGDNSTPAGSIKAAEIAVVRNGPSQVLGWEGEYYWRSFEDATAGSYNFGGTTCPSTSGSGFDCDYIAITGYVSGTAGVGAGPVYSSPRRMGVYIYQGYFFSDNVATNSIPIPTYILTNSAYGPLGPNGTSYGYWTSNGSIGATAALWRSSVMARFQLLIAAIGSHVLPDGYTVDTSPYIEWIKVPTETAESPTGTTDSSYSDAGFVTQLEALAAGLSTVFPHTSAALTNNYTAFTTSSNALEQYLPTVRVAGSGPDTFGASSGQYASGAGFTYGQASYYGLVPPFGAGNTGGTPLAGVVPFIGTVQNTETIAGYGYGPYTPLDILNQANYLQMTHISWQYITYGSAGLSSQCAASTVTAYCETANWFGNAGNQTSWSAGGDTVGGVLTTIVNHPLTQTGCPSKYGSCNTLSLEWMLLLLPSVFRRRRAANDDHYDQEIAA